MPHTNQMFEPIAVTRKSLRLKELHQNEIQLPIIPVRSRTKKISYLLYDDFKFAILAADGTDMARRLYTSVQFRCLFTLLKPPNFFTTINNLCRSMSFLLIVGNLFMGVPRSSMNLYS
ncbi:hypothetical protein BpHYR1_029235 [Brachionus plicatilis]|uniref:Uncharacterized protein n=1 Tax=Brachionus plicatilis TaxID=10195 RepID=A0A3M7S4K4_BRAPC|nr:hypothetical protein BpHYR1_029235 [Brachionus plicatilis]